MKRILASLAVLACTVFCQSISLADEPQFRGQDREDQINPTELKQVLDRESVSLPKMIEAAEKKAGGKAVAAKIKEWGDVKSSFSGPFNDDLSEKDVRNLDPSHPVGKICVLGNNDQLVEVLVCGKSGKIIATQNKNDLDKNCAENYRGRENRTDEANKYDHRSGETVQGQSYQDRSRNSLEDWSVAPRRWQRVTDLMKKSVKSDNNEKIGDVKDLVIDPDAGAVIYTIVEFDRKMGHGNRYFALPLSVARLSDDYKDIAMRYNSSEVNSANGFDSSNWPNFADQTWSAQVYKAYGQNPYWENRERTQTVSERQTNRDNQQRTERDRQYMDRGRDDTSRSEFRSSETRLAPKRWEKASDLVGKKVRNLQTNEDLGSLKDIVVDPDTGRILYAVLAYGGFLGMGKDFFAIPWQSFDTTSEARTIGLNINKDQLKNAEGFDKNNWPNMADPRWSANIHKYYGKQEPWRNRD